MIWSRDLAIPHCVATVFCRHICMLHLRIDLTLNHVIANRVQGGYTYVRNIYVNLYLLCVFLHLLHKNAVVYFRGLFHDTFFLSNVEIFVVSVCIGTNCVGGNLLQFVIILYK